MNRPHRYSVAAIVRRDDGSFLAVRRPPDDDHLPDVWGLPAVTVAPGESPPAAIRRLGHQKLGVTLIPGDPVGSKEGDRGEYLLTLTDWEARIAGGEPDVRAAPGPGTRYTDQQWTTDPEILREAADRGSLCCKILLESLAADADRLR